MIFVMETLYPSWSEGLPPGFWDVHNIHQLKEGYGNLRQRQPSMSLSHWVGQNDPVVSLGTYSKSTEKMAAVRGQIGYIRKDVGVMGRPRS